MNKRFIALASCAALIVTLLLAGCAPIVAPETPSATDSASQIPALALDEFVNSTDLTYETVIAKKAVEHGLTLTQAEMEEAYTKMMQDVLNAANAGQTDPNTLDYEKLVQYYYLNFLESKLIKAATTAPTIDDAEIRQWYDDRLAYLQTQYVASPTQFPLEQLSFDMTGTMPPFFVPEGYKYVKHIFVKDAEVAASALERAKAGEDFDALIEELGEDGGMNKEPYMSTGYIVGPADSILSYDPAFEAAAVALQNVGDMTDVVESSLGYHIIKCVKVLEPGIVPFEVSEPYIRSLLELRDRTEEFQTLLAGWMEGK